MNTDPKTLLAPLYRAHVTALAARYAAVLAMAGADGVVIHAGTPKKRSEFDDQYFPLRPTPHFQHWIPLNEADASVVIVPGKLPRLLRPKVTSYWERSAPLEASFVLESFDVATFEEGTVPSTLLPPRARLAFVGESRETAVKLGIDDAFINPPALVEALDALRVHKSDYEILCLAEANRIAALGHDAVVAGFRAGGVSELELHLAYLKATAQDDPDTPYKNIVAMGENASILHHVSYGRRPNDAVTESLLLDAGASYNGYCSDITRTWVKGTGAAASAFAGLIEGVEAMQRRLCGVVTVGMGYEALHDECHRQLGEVLRSVGIVRISGEEAVAKGITRAFLPHGLGHSLGLQCHDVGCALIKPRTENPWLRNTSIIEERQVFTIEPGVYFIDALMAALRSGGESASIDWALVDTITPMGGIRIEDDLVVKAKGAGVRNLTRELIAEGGGLL